ncbi:thioredoxin family protein [Halobacteriales archaeon SW_5_68_122]|nr:MAG: thioredoxin family protein [Halobacteriales archaeon SW_5_68_122]
MVALESETDALEPGDRAPEFGLRGTDGGEYSLSDFDNYDALLVVFTCNHCPYAQAKFDAMNDIADAYDDVTAYLRDESQMVAEAYGAVCTPDPFLFRNDDDTFRLAYHGRFDDALNPDEEPSGAPGFEMRDVIEDVLAGEEPTDEFRPSRGCSIKWRE